MLDELQRRNYSQNTVYTYLHAVEDFSRYFHRSPDRLGPDHIRQTGWDLIISGSIRRICFENASSRQERLHAAPQLCVFSTSRRCDAHICPSTSHFPSAPGNCPLCSAQKKFSG